MRPRIVVTTSCWRSSILYVIGIPAPWVSNRMRRAPIMWARTRTNNARGQIDLTLQSRPFAAADRSPEGRLFKDLLPAQQFSKDPVVERSLRHSLYDGITYSLMTGSAESYFSAFAILLKATTAQIGLLASLPPLLASFMQLFSAWLGRRTGHRKQIIVFGALVQATTLVPLTLLPLLFPDDAVFLLLDLLDRLLRRPEPRLPSVEQSDGRHRPGGAARTVLRAAHTTGERREFPRADRRRPDTRILRFDAASRTGAS